MVASDTNTVIDDKVPIPKTCIDLTIIKKFTKFTQGKQKKKPIKKYMIELLYINKQNLCYMVKLSQSKKYMYLAIKPSYYNLEGYNLSFEPYLRARSPTQLSILLQCVKDYNYWVAIESELAGLIKQEVPLSKPIMDRVVPLYPYIIIDNWIELKNPMNIDKHGNILGFYSNELAYYFSPIRKPKALRTKQVACIPLLYHPDSINEAIFKDKKAVVDERCVDIDKALYKHHLYQLLVLEFMDLLNEERNNRIRILIIGAIKKQSKNWGSTLIQINTIIDKHYKGINHSKDDAMDDKRKLNQQIRLAVFQKNDKPQIINTIKSSTYNFDRITISRLKGMDLKKVINELHKISKKITHIESIEKIKNFKFPNIYVSCINYYKLNKAKRNKMPTDNIGYCKDRKLRITKSVLEEYIQLLAVDIIDPLKSKYMYSMIFAEKNLYYYKFIKRPTEKIKIIIQ